MVQVTKGDSLSKSKSKNSNEKKVKKAKQFKKMMRDSKPKRDRKGNILKPAEYQTSSKPGEVARVEPNRKWFGNTRVITQSHLQKFVNDANSAKKDPYKVIIKPGKLPLSLLLDFKKKKTVNILQTESFEETFGKKSLRKRPKLSCLSLSHFAETAVNRVDNYQAEISEDDKMMPREMCFKYGQSKRIWSELHKVLDSSDVIFQVLDARDPEGTRSYYIEKYLRENKAYKHLIFVLNKCDLVPNSVIKHWMYLLSKDNPTVAFRAGIQRSFGKSSIFSLLRQFSKLHSDKKSISVGFIGYPNVGKSSIINTLVGRKVCTVAPIPGETKVWQFISLMKRVHLIDCPGVVYSTNDTESDIIMKGVVRVEYIKEPSQYMPEILKRVRQEYLSRTYGVISWTDANDFLQKVSHKSGRLLKGGEPDLETVSKMIINDFQRGKLPYFVPPPKFDASQQQIPQPDIVIKIDEQKLEEINKTAEFLPSHINATL